MVFDLKIIEEAAILTGVGIGTSFGLLVVLLVAATILGRITAIAESRRVARVPTSSELDAERRDKAMAAVTALAALIENPEMMKGPQEIDVVDQTESED